MNYRYRCSGIELKYDPLPDDVFIPSQTSTFILETLIKNRSEFNFSKVLDLGCGIGIISHFISKSGLSESKVHGSDTSEKSIEVAKAYSARLNLNNEFRVGSLFECWENHKFSLIINDVSGLAHDIIRITSWFGNKEQRTGEQGDELTLKIISQASDRLMPGGKLLTVVMGLQRQDRILGQLDKNFVNIKEIDSQFWPLNDDLRKNINLLHQMQNQNKINLIEKWGMLGWTSLILVGEKC